MDNLNRNCSGLARLLVLVEHVVDCEEDGLVGRESGFAQLQKGRIYSTRI